MNKIHEELKTITLGLIPDAILENEAHFDMQFQDIGIDSLDSMNMLLAVQEQFGVTIPDEAFNQLNTMNQVRDFIVANKG